MIVSALTPTGDWTFGIGVQNYLTGAAAIQQEITTRLKMFLGDCFFSLNSGIDWFNLLGSKNQLGLDLACRTVILNTYGVSGIYTLDINVTHLRHITITYSVVTIYSNQAVQGAVTLPI